MLIEGVEDSLLANGVLEGARGPLNEIIAHSADFSMPNDRKEAWKTSYIIGYHTYVKDDNAENFCTFTLLIILFGIMMGNCRSMA